jgi:hypothetical protein
LQDCDAVHLRQHQIQHHQGGQFFTNGGQGRTAVAGDPHLKPFPLQIKADHFHHRSLVIHH